MLGMRRNSTRPVSTSFLKRSVRLMNRNPSGYNTKFLRRPAFSMHTNRLIHEKSPYLLQHAHNPVDWYAWGEEAFAKAKKEGKLVFLSIGYSSCYWCHVMERESFQNEEVAKALAEGFVC